jgi:hypothetical protein
VEPPDDRTDEEAAEVPREDDRAHELGQDAAVRQLVEDRKHDPTCRRVGIDNQQIVDAPRPTSGEVIRRERRGGLLSHCQCEAV